MMVWGGRGALDLYMLCRGSITWVVYVVSTVIFGWTSTCTDMQGGDVTDEHVTCMSTTRFNTVADTPA
jgi:hypothetical protein